MAAVLQTVGLTKRIGNAVAVNQLSLRLEKGARHALIGAVGAGKTLVLDLLAGTLAPSAGRILFDGRDIAALGMTRRLQLGIARTFEVPRLCADLTALEMVCVVVSERMGIGARWWAALGRRPEVSEEAAQVIGQCRLAGVMHQRAARLPPGRQKMLDLALAVACRPRVLLLDEPTAGLSEDERADFRAAMAELPAEMAVLMVARELDDVRQTVRRVSVLVDGVLGIEWAPDEMGRNAQAVRPRPTADRP